MRNPLIAGNWKLNGDLALCSQLAAELPAVTASDGVTEIVICPPSVYLQSLLASLAGSGLKAGAQNVAAQIAGAYTGEISAAMLSEVGCDYAIVGHSERRSLFGESDAQVLEKTRRLLENGVVPIVCVGEDLDVRERGDTLAWIESQVTAVLDHLPAGELAGLVIAYEPVWAIGTGKTATPAQAQEVHEFIRGIIRRYDGAAAEEARVIYGGSVKAANAAELLAMPDIDGALVGGASLDLAEFASIVQAAN